MTDKHQIRWGIVLLALAMLTHMLVQMVSWSNYLTVWSAYDFSLVHYGGNHPVDIAMRRLALVSGFPVTVIFLADPYEGGYVFLFGRLSTFGTIVSSLLCVIVYAVNTLLWVLLAKLLVEAGQAIRKFQYGLADRPSDRTR